MAHHPGQDQICIELLCLSAERGSYTKVSLLSSRSAAVIPVYGGTVVSSNRKLTFAMVTIAVLAGTTTYAADKYALKSPRGIAFADFKGY